MEELFTISEVAARLKVTRDAVYKWIRKGRLEAVYAGDHMRVTRSALEQFIAQSTERAHLARRDTIDRIESPSLAAA
jgi:excisionase family DNA binding protein